MQRALYNKTWQILLTLFLGVGALIIAKPFLVPVCFAGLMAMLFLPLCRRLENARINRGISAFICVIILAAILTTIIWLISWQVTNITNDLGNLEGKVESLLQHVKDFITRTFGISDEKQQQMLEKQSENSGSFIAGISLVLMDVITGLILILVYIFLFLYYRKHIKKFILNIIPKKDDANAADAILSIQKVSQQYLTGMSQMILCLWIMYSIGFSLVGLKNPFFFAILCGLFEIVPFVGNFVGNLLAALMAVTQGGGLSMVIGVLITYSIIQFIQTYLLEPLIVGSGVDINPLFTIMGLVIGELVWGIVGMVLAIPVMAIFKIICDHVPELKPYGILIGREKKTESSLLIKFKNLFSKEK